MASVYRWTNTGTGNFNLASNWTLVSGPGNSNGYPAAGDTAIVPSGTVVGATDQQLTANTIEAGGTTAVTAFIFTGDSLITEANPTFDSATLVDMSVPGQDTAEQVLVDSIGTFVNQGTIEANGPTGSAFTLNVQQGTSGAPGSFSNYGTFEIDAGNTMDVVVGTDAVFSDLAAIQVSGGRLSVSGSGLAIGGTPITPQQNGGTLDVTASGRVQAAGGLEIWSGSTVSVDSTSAIDVGTSGSFDAGAILVESAETLLGNGVVAGALVNDGVVEASNLIASSQSGPGTLEITGALTGTGVVNMDRSAILQLDGSVTATQTINFATGGSELILSNPPGTFTAAIDNLNTGDEIEFGSGVVVESASVAAGTVTVMTTTGSIVLNDVSFASGANQSFYTTQDASTGDWAIVVNSPVSSWIGGTTLSTSGNWSSGLPNSSDEAVFSNGGGTLTGSLTAGSFYISGSGTFNFIGATLDIDGQPSEPGLPGAGEFLADTVLNDSTLNAAPTGTTGGTTNIRAAGGITVTAENGSTVTTLGDIVGNHSGQSGSLVLTGAGTNWTEEPSQELNGDTSGYLAIGDSSGSTGTLSVSNGASLVTGTFAGLGEDSGAEGYATISSGGSWSAPQFAIGESGDGTVTIGSGGTISISTNGTFNAVGQNAGSTGELVIDAGGTFVSTAAPSLGNFLLSIGDKGASGTLAPASGYVLVDGGVLNLNGTSGTDYNALELGQNGGSGALTVENGGSVVVGTANSADGAALSVGKQGSGTITVTGVGSTLTADGFTYFGREGNAALLVENDAVVQIDTDPLGSGGLNIGTGLSSGPPAGGTGSATIESGGSLYSAQYIDVGGGGVTGTLNVSDGTVEAGTRLLVGLGNVASGTTLGGSGIVNIGPGGVVNIEGNGITASGTAGLSIGTYEGSTVNGAATGTVNVSGADAILNVGSHYINIGNTGAGYLTVSQGGSVLAGTTFAADAATIIGNQATGVGVLTVSGPGSTYDADGQVDVGTGGTGSLLIQGGGTVLSGNNPVFAQGGFVIGHDAGGTGNVTVTGAGSELINIGQFNVGGSGNTSDGTAQVGGVGTMLIEDGGLVTSNLPASGYTGPAGDIGADPGTDGSEVTVTGTNSTWYLGGSLVVGNLAQGSLNVVANGTVTTGGDLDVGESAAGDMAVSSGGTVNVGGTLNVGTNPLGSGVFDLEGASSLVQVNGDLNIGGVFVMGNGTLSVSGAGVDTGQFFQTGGVVDPSSFTVAAGHGLGGGSTITPYPTFSVGTLTVNGSLYATAGTYVISGGTYASEATIVGTGTIETSNNGDLDLNATVGNGLTVDFLDNTGTITIGDLDGFTPKIIDGFQAGDVLDISGGITSGALASYSFDSSTDVLTLTDTDGNSYTLDFASGTSPSAFGGAIFNSDGSQVACYLHGTRILTDRGEVPVESLAIGDNVITRSGKPRPIKWIGRRSYDGAFAAANPTLAPVLIRAGALADSIPHRDLYVSSEHAMFIDGVLVPARHLVNGTSILATRDIDPIRYFHVELAQHDVIYAEGAAAETFVDCDSRNLFQNAAEYAQLYPDEPSPGSVLSRPLPLTPSRKGRGSEWRFCARVVERGRKLEAINKRLAARAAGAASNSPLDGYIDYAEHAGIAGWAWCNTQPDTPVRLEILTGDKTIGTTLAGQFRADLKDAGIGDGRHGFELRFTRPLDPFLRHEITIRRAIDHAPLGVGPIVVEPVERLDDPAREAVAALLRTATARAESVAEAEELHHLLLAEARQAQLARLRLLRREGAIEHRRGAVPAPARRALVIDEAWPRTDHDAGSQAIVSHMRALQRLRWHVSFTATAPLADNAIAKPTLEALGIACHAAPEVGSVEELLRDAADQYQLVYLHRLPVASAYAGLVRRYQPAARLIYSVADLHHLRLARQAAVEARPELARRAATLRRQELLAVLQADAVITHSRVEAAVLAHQAPGAQVQVVPWAVRPGASPRPWANRHGIVLVANFAHEPNADGLLWLAREVMPLVWPNAPDVTLTVAGAGLPAGIARLLTDVRLKLLGHVPDLRPLLAGARLAVAPLRYGAGIKGKVLEAWAAGLPCAMTPIAAEGLPLDATLTGSVAADAQSLAQLILALHIDPAHNTALSRAGRAALRRHFSQKQVDAALAAALVRPSASVHAIQPRSPAAA